MKAMQTMTQKMLDVSFPTSKKEIAEYHNSSLRRAVMALYQIEGTIDERFSPIIEQLHNIIETELTETRNKERSERDEL